MFLCSKARVITKGTVMHFTEKDLKMYDFTSVFPFAKQHSLDLEVACL